MINKNQLKLAIPTDAISMDVETAFLVGKIGNKFSNLKGFLIKITLI